jgi:hypothetical protein
MESQSSNQNNIPEQKLVVPQEPEAPTNVGQASQNAADSTPQATLSPQPNSLNGTTQNLPHNEPIKLTENAEKLKKLSILVMVGGLIGAAVIAVIAVLAGSFNDTFGKALFTLLLVMLHALACLGFVEQTGKSKNTSFKFFENAVFSIIVLSFFTSIFGVWGLFSGDIVGKLYLTYLVLVFACLHGQMLVETRGKQPSIDMIVNVNYVLMSLVVVLLLPLIWLATDGIPGFYYRLLAACGIIDGTLTILAVILHRLYLQKHPTAQSVIFSVTTQVGSNGQSVPAQVVEQKRHIHPLVWLLGIFIVGQFIISLLFAALGAFYR